MQKPDAETVALFERALPADARARAGQMFGHPCAFVNGNMFFGTFANSVVARVGAERVAALADRYRMFEPMEGRAWKEYVVVPTGEAPDREVAALAAEALEHTARLPPKVPKARSAKGKAAG